MYSYIIIHHTHESVEVALFLDNTLHSSITHEKRLVSKMLISSLQSLLEDNALSLSQLSFIGINQGPGLFSTLRSIIATVNGLHFAAHIPLIGIDALEVTAHEYYNSSYQYTAVLLDAFNHEVYYAITHNNVVISIGYKNITKFLKQLTEYPTGKKIYFVGRGTELYKNVILDTCNDLAVIPEIIPNLCSLHAIADKALEKFQHNKKGPGYLDPLHLKKHPVELL